jgi:hypothetical protein
LLLIPLECDLLLQRHQLIPPRRFQFLRLMIRQPSSWRVGFQ